MKISELPEGIRLKSMEYIDRDTDCLQNAFHWHLTKEGVKYWSDLCEKEPEPTIDQNVNNVIESFKQRSEVGFNKYGTTTERTDIDLLGWLQHLQEELMDATIYIERLKNETETRLAP